MSDNEIPLTLAEFTRKIIAQNQQSLDIKRNNIEEDLRSFSKMLSNALGPLRDQYDHETILMMQSYLRRLTAWYLADFNPEFIRTFTIDQLDRMRSPAEEVSRIANELEQSLVSTSETD